MALAVFVCAADGTMVVGLLPAIARDLNVSTAAAGQSVSVFAAVYALGAPVLALALRRKSQKRLLTGALALFIVSNVGTALARNLPSLLGARAVAAAAAGLIVPTAAVATAAFAEPSRRGRALSAVISGGAAGTALGVPAGTSIGAATSWRIAFLVLAATAAVTMVAVARILPPREQTEARSEFAPAALVRALPVLAVTSIWAAGSFTFFTFVSNVLDRAAGVGAGILALFLLIYGVCGVAASKAAGWLTDLRGAQSTLHLALSLTALSLVGLGFLAADGRPDAIHAAAAAALLALYAIGTWSVTPPQQLRLLAVHGNQRILLALNASALYAGVALGGVVGGAVLAAGYTAPSLCWIAAGVEGLALAAVVLTRASPHVLRERPAEVRWRRSA